jgi:hypothetical protein
MFREDLGTSLSTGDQYVKFTLTFSDLTTAGASQTITLQANPGGNAVNPADFQIPQGGVIKYARIHHTTAFTGGALNGMTASIGKKGASNTFVSAAFNVFQTAADGNLEETWNVSSGQQSAWSVTVTFVGTGGNVNAATAGSVDFYIIYQNVTTPNA